MLHKAHISGKALFNSVLDHLKERPSEFYPSTFWFVRFLFVVIFQIILFFYIFSFTIQENK